MAVFQRTVADVKGNVVPHAEVEIRRESGGALPVLYTDPNRQNQTSNPAFANSEGFIQVFLDPGVYKVSAYKKVKENIVWGPDVWRFVNLLPIDAADNIKQIGKLRVDADDVLGYLEDKLAAGSNITITKNNNEGVKTLTIAATGGGSGLVSQTILESAAQTITVSDLSIQPAQSYRIEAELIIVDGTATDSLVLNGVTTSSEYVNVYSLTSGPLGTDTTVGFTQGGTLYTSSFDSGGSSVHITGDLRISNNMAIFMFKSVTRSLYEVFDGFIVFQPDGSPAVEEITSVGVSSSISGRFGAGSRLAVYAL